MEKIKVVCYARVSTNSADQTNSFENQQLYFHNETSKEETLELVKIFADKGLTGTKFKNRPQLIEMVNLCGIKIDKNDNFYIYDKYIKPPFERIYFKNTSRLARSSKAFELVRLLREKGVYCIFIEQNIDSSNINSDLLLNIIQVLDRSDSQDKSIKVKTGVLMGIEKGVIQANSRLFGYKYIQSENRLEIIESEAEIVRKIYRLYVDEGLGYKRISDKLEELGYTTRAGKRFAKSSLMRILSNGKYAGLSERNKYERPKLFTNEASNKIRPREEWIVANTNKIPSIIDMETFKKAQQIIKSRTNINGRHGIYSGKGLFARKLYCVCGDVYYHDMDGKRAYYRCHTKKTRGVKVCSNPNIDEKRLLEEISNENYKVYLQGIRLVRIKKLKSHITKLENMFNQDSEVEVNQKKEELNALKEKKDKIIKSYIDGILTKDEIQVIKSSVDIEIEQLESYIELLESGNKEIESLIEIDRNEVEAIKNLRIKEEYTTKDILKDIEKIVVLENGELDINWRFDRELI